MLDYEKIQGNTQTERYLSSLQICDFHQYRVPPNGCAQCPPQKFTLTFGQTYCQSCDDFTASQLATLNTFQREKILVACSTSSTEEVAPIT